MPTVRDGREEVFKSLGGTVERELRCGVVAEREGEADNSSRVSNDSTSGVQRPTHLTCGVQSAFTAFKSLAKLVTLILRYTIGSRAW